MKGGTFKSLFLNGQLHLRNSAGIELITPVTLASGADVQFNGSNAADRLTLDRSWSRFTGSLTINGNGGNDQLDARAVNRPKYVVLCNFDEFWVYDFDSAQIDTPLDIVRLADLPERFGPLAFLFPTNEKPVFGNDHEAVTREATDRLAACFNHLIARGIERLLAQRFILQMLVSMFAEDIGLLDKYFVTQLLDECHRPADSYDLLGGLFVEMNTPGKTPGGRYKGVNYFNGGLFAEPARIELDYDELQLLRVTTTKDWSKVRPEIFGTLFEHSLSSVECHTLGATTRRKRMSIPRAAAEIY